MDELLNSPAVIEFKETGKLPSFDTVIIQVYKCTENTILLFNFFDGLYYIEYDENKNLEEKNQQIATLQLNMKGLQSTILDLPKQIKAVEEMMNVISKKQETSVMGRGEHEVHHREQVKSDTRKN